jgi:hypothetical protein
MPSTIDTTAMMDMMEMTTHRMVNDDRNLFAHNARKAMAMLSQICCMNSNP